MSFVSKNNNRPNAKSSIGISSSSKDTGTYTTLLAFTPELPPIPLATDHENQNLIRRQSKSNSEATVSQVEEPKEASVGDLIKALRQTELGQKIEDEATKTLPRKLLSAGLIVGGAIATESELPPIPLGKRFSIQLKGPANKPNGAAIGWSHTFGGESKSKNKTPDIETLRKEMHNFREWMKTPEEREADRKWLQKNLPQLKLPRSEESKADAPKLQRSAKANDENTGQVPHIVNNVIQSSGRPLETNTRQLMESQFGHDFSNVRIHNDSLAFQSADAISARAYTFGRHVVFNRGEYSPLSPEGQKLMAHELTHVIQQRATNESTLPRGIGGKSDNVEKQANQMASHFEWSPASLQYDSTKRIRRVGIYDQPTERASEATSEEPISMPGWIDLAVNILTTYAGDIGEIAIGLIPIVGDIYDVVTAIIGKTLVTGEILDPVDRLLSLAGVIPIPFVSGKVLRMGKSAVEYLIKHLGGNPISLLYKAIKRGGEKLKELWSKAERALEKLADKHPMLDVFDNTGAIGPDVSKIKGKNKSLTKSDVRNDAPSNVIDFKSRKRLSKTEADKLPKNSPPDKSPISKQQQKIHAKTRSAFRRFVMRELKSDPSHPLQFLVIQNPKKTKWKFPARKGEGYRDNIDRLFDAGRVAHQKSGAREIVGVEATAMNIAKGEKKGISLVSKFVDVAGIPVEENTAKYWVSLDLLQAKHVGGYVEGWSP